MTWTLTPDGPSPGGLITGYILYMDDGKGGAFTPIFNSIDYSPTLNYFLVSNLITALPYRFYLVAYNTNGAGPASNIATYPPCSTPSGFARPSRVSSTLSSITISWQEPLNNGGC